MAHRYYHNHHHNNSSTTTTLTANTSSTRHSHPSPPKPPPTPPPPINRDLSTRNTCALFLALTWLTGLASTGGGLYLLLYTHHWTDFHGLPLPLPPLVKRLAPLAVNVWLTVLQDSLGYVHAASLKWGLARQGRLAFNSNLRLFTSAPASSSSVANAWYVNAVMLAAMVVAYASSSLLLVNAYDDDDDDNNIERLMRIDGWSVDADAAAAAIGVSGTAAVCLGAALLVQAAVATCALASTATRAVPTWSSSPVDAVVACQEVAAAEGIVGVVSRHQPGRCLLGVADAPAHAASSRVGAVAPRRRQRASWAAHKGARTVVWLLWALATLASVGAVAVELLMTRRGAGEPGVALTGGHQLLGMGVFAALQAGVTLALHAAELPVGLTRDELAWRRAARRGGYRLEGYDAVWAAVSSWQAVVLFLAKPAIHWVFGLAVTVEYGWVYVRGVPFFCLAGAVAALAAYVTALSVWRPKGPQPAAYGHIQTLTDLIDEWSPVLYWGHKVSGPICHAGTSSRPMADIEMDQLYAGETWER
ncbi:e3 ubiquitin-protein ligase upl4 [Diplodia corticola]|uniref:E3 ubiquitin-protein ligase upl4 n=1 Tax=Diplodia corticola TaxID=236234 RepID=A0A1J9RH03_9PEZI|nr:e3 ubiquitin-protein ligase upl4 [Diplodia corticola]OJD31827.1 e3 ubiquitin-protein ligase upl4 [Diplodia corticola]